MSKYYEPEKRATRPSTSGWGLLEEGRQWYAKDTHRLEYWDGTQVQSQAVSPMLRAIYEYCVYKDANYVYVANGKTGGVTTYPLSTPAAAIQAALDAVSADSRTSSETVQLNDDFLNMEDQIKMPQYCNLLGPSTLKPINNLNKDLIVLKDPTNVRAVVLQEIYIDGNSANQSSGNGVMFNPNQDLQYTDWEPYYTEALIRVKARNCKEHGIYLNHTNNVNCGPVYIERLETHQCGGEGMHMANVTDSDIYAWYSAGAYIDHCTSSFFHAPYWGHQSGFDSAIFNNCQRVRVADAKIDSPSHNGMVLQNGCRSMNICNSEIKIASQLTADNTYDGLKIDGSTYNVIMGVTCHKTSGTNKVKYCIEEINAGDYNCFGGPLILEDYVTGGIHKIGANSKIDIDALIGTSV